MAGEISGDVGPRKRKEERGKERKQAKGGGSGGSSRVKQPVDGIKMKRARESLIWMEQTRRREKEREKREEGGKERAKSGSIGSRYPGPCFLGAGIIIDDSTLDRKRRSNRRERSAVSSVFPHTLQSLQFRIESKVKIAMSEHVLILDIFLIVLVSGYGYLNILNTYHVLNIPCTLC